MCSRSAGGEGERESETESQVRDRQTWRQTHGDGDRERNQSYTQTPWPVISFHRRCQADAWSPRCPVCGRWALWSAGRRMESGPLPPWPTSPPVLWSPRPGDLCRFTGQCRVGLISPPPSLPAFSESVFNCRSRQQFSESGCRVGSRLWARDLVGLCGSVPSLRRTADLESEPPPGSVSLAVIIPAAHAAVTEAWDQLGAWGLGPVAFLGPLPPRCGPSPPLRAAGSRESLQRAQGFLWGLAPSPECFTAGFYGILTCMLFCFVLVSELLAGTAVLLPVGYFLGNSAPSLLP